MALGGMLRFCELDPVLLGSGKPHALLGSVLRDDTLFLGARFDFTFRGTFTLPDGWCLIAYVHRTPRGSWYHGRELRPGTALTVLPEGSTEIVFQAGLEWSAVLLPLPRLRERFASLTGSCMAMPDRLTLFVPEGRASGERLAERYDFVRAHLLDGDDAAGVELTSLDGAGETLDAHLLAGLSATTDECPQLARGRRAHYQVFRRAEAFMRANMRHEIYIRSLCNAAGASERALRYAFQDLLGLSPNRYLSMLRLCAACRSLAQADARRRSVKSIALSCGLWDLSRFAEHYRRVFGELPSETLVREDEEPLAHAQTA